MRASFTLLLLLYCSASYAQLKLSPKLLQFSTRINTNDIKQFSVSYYNFDRLLNTYKDRVTILYNYKQGRVATLTAQVNIVNEFSTDNNIVFVDIINSAKPEAGTDYFNIAFNKINLVRDQFPELNGSDQKILIKEQRFDTTNIDLLHRVFETGLASTASSQHATTIATIIAGAGNSSENTKGIATHAQIASADFENLLPDADFTFTGANVHLENHSYGVEIENYYGNEAAAYDLQVYNNPTLLHVFSAGNSGMLKPTQGIYNGLLFANLSGNLKQAKNVLTITAVDTSFAVNARNSRGPAYDGRLKPELTAFGQDGTSDAAAIGSGVCALLQQRYVELYQKFPSVSEVKSILIASADDIGQEGIDYSSGYGSINALRAIKLLEKGNVITHTINKDDVITVPINVPSSTHKLSVSLTWIDPPAIQNNPLALVNDIDAVLSDGVTEYNPWLLSTAPNTDSLQAKAMRKPDHINTSEYFTIDEPSPGNYNLIITAPKITTTQSVAIAYWVEEENAFSWNYPTHGDKLESGKKTTLIWDVQHKQTGTLYLQLNNGEWTTLKENINLNSNFSWFPPDTLIEARLKMKIDGNEYVSESFLISAATTLTVAYNCDEDIALNWKAVPGANEYNIYTLGDKYLKKVKTVTDTVVVMLKSNNFYFAVAPILNSSTGINSQTINYTNQGSLCYINLFDAIRFEDDRITVQLTLSTLYKIDHVSVYKIVNHDTTQLLNSSSLVIDNLWYDYNLAGGEMQYLAEVVLSNGIHIRSEIRSLYIEQKDKVILYPNPIQNNELSILTEGTGLTITISNLAGEIVQTQILYETIEVVYVNQLKPGLYILELRRNGHSLDRKKFLKI